MSLLTTATTTLPGSSESGSDFDNISYVDNVTASQAESLYNANGNCLKSLVVLCLGLMDDLGADFLDIDQPPFNVFKRKDTKPNAAMLEAEVARRYKSTNPAGSTVGPRPKHWGRGQLQNWLSDNPIKREAKNCGPTSPSTSCYSSTSIGRSRAGWFELDWTSSVHAAYPMCC
jgi:hypothetical protein